LVTAVAPGTVTITASSENTSATAVITVVAARRPVGRIALVGGGIGLAALVIALLVFRPFGGQGPPVAGAEDSLPAAAQGADTQAVATIPTPVTPPAETTAGGGRPVTDSPTRPPRPRQTVVVRDSSESTVATALAGARSARASAVDAGAGAAALAAGDTELQQAADLRRAGRRAEAFGHLRTATTLFTAAESTATAARLAAQRRPPPDTAPKPPPPPPVTPPPAPVVDPEPAIRSSIAAYMRALENRDIGAVARVFPDIPQALSEAWRQFFRGAEEIKASWTALRIAPSGDQAEARIAMTLTFKRADNHAPDRTRSEVTMQLARRSADWVITAIH
jgi:hypothetical protein